MAYGNQGYRQQATMAASPFADSFRQDLASMQGNPQFMGGLGSMLQQYREKLGGGQAQKEAPSYLTQGKANDLFNQINNQTLSFPKNPFAAAASEFTRTGEITRDLTQGPENAAQPAQLLPTRPEPVNPFEGNEQYQALMEYQKSMAPQQEQLDRLNELRTAFEGTGGYKDYRIQQMEQQMQRMQQPRMGMGLGGMRPTGMGMFGGFPQQPQRQFGQMPMFQPMVTPRGGYNQYQNQFGAMGYNQPQQNPYQQQPYQQQQYGMMGGYQQNPYQQMRPQPQQFGGYGMGQGMGGYGRYGGMQNSYAPQQYGQQSMGQPQQFGRMY